MASEKSIRISRDPLCHFMLADDGKCARIIVTNDLISRRG